jgi:hypothetical protein
MLCGLAGMAYYSSPTVAHASAIDYGDGDGYDSVRPEDPDFLLPDEDEDDVLLRHHGSPYIAMQDDGDDDETNPRNADIGTENPTEGDHVEQEGSSILADNMVTSEDEVVGNNGSGTVLCCFEKFQVQERTLGILAALVFTGIWGGSILVPMQFAPKMDKGLGYLISFAIGAALVNLSLWLFRYLYLCLYYSSMTQAYQALPSFHLRKMWLYGGICGLLWSIGNFFSILAVESLGEGVGYSATQASMLVSGLWGIFYFQEIEGFETISKWYLSAMITVMGIILLSVEHHEK